MGIVAGLENDRAAVQGSGEVVGNNHVEVIGGV